MESNMAPSGSEGQNMGQRLGGTQGSGSWGGRGIASAWCLPFIFHRGTAPKPLMPEEWV